jgi:hypothetical protein
MSRDEDKSSEQELKEWIFERKDAVEREGQPEKRKREREREQFFLEF